MTPPLVLYRDDDARAQARWWLRDAALLVGLLLLGALASCVPVATGAGAPTLILERLDAQQATAGAIEAARGGTGEQEGGR